jgi:hypothetical protein
MKVLILITLVAFIINYKCDIKQCSSKHLDEGFCVSPTLDTDKNITIFDINVKNCPEDKICPYVVDNSRNLECSPKPIAFNRYDGQACTNNTHCASNDCINNKCLGKPENSPCNQNSECRIGYFCGTKDISSGVRNCLPQRGLNSTCENDEDCFNNMGCVKNTCVEYFSLPIGSQIENASWKVCKSGKVHNGYCVSLKLIDNEECTGQQEFCKYSVEGSVDKKQINLPCQCSNAYSDKNFCDIDSNRSEWIRFIEKMKDWYSQHNKNYHTDNRHNYHIGLYRLYKTMAEYPQHKDAESCFVEWELHELSGVTNKIGLILLLLIFVIYN